MICMTVAASLTLVAKQVRQSREAHAGTTPVVLTLPTVPFSPTHPLKPAGMRPALACSLASVKWQPCSLVTVAAHRQETNDNN